LPGVLSRGVTARWNALRPSPSPIAFLALTLIQSRFLAADFRVLGGGRFAGLRLRMRLGEPLWEPLWSPLALALVLLALRCEPRTRLCLCLGIEPQQGHLAKRVWGLR
jgi:hypothetical protein